MRWLSQVSLRYFLYFTLALQMSKAGADTPPTVADTLKSLGVGLDHFSLCQALTDPRPLARTFAAAELAGQGDKTAIPEIEAALSAEKDQMTVFNLATSLVILGSETGVGRMEAICSSTGMEDNIRIRAADLLGSTRHDYICAPFTLSMIASSDADLRRNSLLYLNTVPASEKDHAAFGPPLLSVAINDPDPHLRELAGKTLAVLGDDQSKKAWALMFPPS